MRYIPNSFPPNYYQQEGAVYNTAPYYFGGYGYNQNYYYNQPYYGYGYYNQFNPIEIQRRQEQEEIQRRNWFNQQKSAWCKLIQCNCTYYNLDYNQNMYFVDEWEIPNQSVSISITNDTGYQKSLTVDTTDNTIGTESLYDHIVRINNEEYQRSNLLRILNMQEEQKIQKSNQIQLEEEIRRNYKYDGKDESLFDYFRGTGRERYIQFINEQAYHQSKNLGRLYNSPGYSELLGIHNGNPQAISPDYNIDDIEITLPEHLKNSYTERRKQFMDSIINSNPNFVIRKG